MTRPFLGLVSLLLVRVSFAAELEPRELSYDSYLRTSFDHRWILPTTGGWQGRDAVDLIGQLETLLSRRFRTIDPEGSTTFGDELAKLVAVRGDRRGVERELMRIERRAPGLHRAAGDLLAELARTSNLDGRDWDPDEDSERDGIYIAEPIDLAVLKSAPWNDLSGSSLLQQGATLMVADMTAIKAAEGDYPRYPEDVGAAYESIRPVPGSLVAAASDEDRPFQGLRVMMRSDLPFPFTTYDCDLRLLTRLRADGTLITDLYAPNDDFYWLAGRDVYLPVKTADGDWVAMLVVRQFGFDLKGVPDGDGDRRAAVRSTLGNLRRRAEARFRAHDGPPRIVQGRLPEPRVRSVP